MLPRLSGVAGQYASAGSILVFLHFIEQLFLSHHGTYNFIILTEKNTGRIVRNLAKVLSVFCEEFCGPRFSDIVLSFHYAKPGLPWA